MFPFGLLLRIGIVTGPEIQSGSVGSPTQRFYFHYEESHTIFNSMDILATVKKTAADHSLLGVEDSVLIALSGGPDSVALLHVLTRLRRSMKLSLTAVYVNHRIRKKAALAEEKFCQELCDRFDIDLDIVSEDIPALARKQKKGIEEAARDFRYELFDLLAREDGHDRIALGHHADDRAETILFRILRGTGTSGLSGIPVKRGRIIRPLYELSKAQILAYLRTRRLSYCIDQSNEGTDYRRNYLRNRLLPEIRKELNPQVDKALLNLADTSSVEDGFLEQLVDKAVRRCISVTVGGKFELDLTNVDRYDTAIRRRLLRRCLKRLSLSQVTPDKEVIERLEKLITSGGKGLSLPGKVQATTVGDRLVLYRREKHIFQTALESGKKTRIDFPAMEFTSRVEDNWRGRPIKERGSREVTLDWEKIRPPLQVRNLRSGDRFRPLGLGGTKKVGDFLTDRRIPPIYRDEIPVVCDAKGIIWVVGQEIDNRVKIDEETKKVITIGFTVRKSGAAGAV